MSEFSEKLRYYLNRNGLTTATFAKTCNIERTLLHKYGKGERVPQNLEIIEMMADKLLLSAEEKTEMLRLWNMERVGKDVFLQREGIKDLLENLNEYTSFHLDSSKFIINFEFGDDKKFYIAKSEIELHMMVRNIMKYESSKERFEIHMCVQPTYIFLNQALLEYSDYHTFSVTQLVCFDQQKSTVVNNIEYVKNILPLAFSLPNYNLKVYYEYANHHINNMSLLPNIILTDEFVILFSFDGKEGIIYREKEIYNFYSGIYENMSKQSKCISTNCTTLEEYMEILLNKNYMYYLNQDPCFGIGFSYEFLDGVIVREIQSRGEFIHRVISDIERRMLEYEKHACYAFFTKGGVNKFITTGRDSEFPPEIYRKLKREECYDLIQQVCDNRDPFYIHNLMLDETKFKYESDIIIHVEIGGLVIFQKPGNQYQRKFVIIDENSINAMFVDFFENLEKMQLVKSKQDTINYLKSLL